MTSADLQRRVDTELTRMREAQFELGQAWERFLFLCRGFRWEEAAEAQLKASALHDAMADHFAQACRATEELGRGGA